VTAESCEAPTFAGQPCRNPASVERRWCWRHAPPAVEVVGGPWDGDTLRSWSRTLFVAYNPTVEQRWRGWGDSALATEAGEVRGTYRRDDAARVWRWERCTADRPADAERERQS
jgi:hypothetical protein